MGVLGADATADAEPNVGILPSDQLDPQHDRAIGLVLGPEMPLEGAGQVG